MTLLAKWLRRASSIFTEKPDVKVDDFGQEHILLYHGLAGSSPENQRQFKDVRADILSAVSRKNSQNLCINLKIAPLWWEDKLHRIFDEARSQSAETTTASLLPPTDSGQESSHYDPLQHEDWRVRANAASILNFLQIAAAEERMIAALHDTAGSASTAYCHIARSLAGFRTEAAKAALAKHLQHDEPWIRVDSINALSKWPLDEVAQLLIDAFKDDHDFIDYASVAVARAHSIDEFLSHDDDQFIDLGAALLVGAMDAAAGTYSSNTDLLPELAVQKCLPPLQAAAAKQASPVRLRALSRLSHWLDKNYHQYRLEAEEYPEPETIAEAREQAQRLISAIDISAAIREALSQSNAGSVRKTAVRHAINLAGEAQLKAAVPELIKILTDAPIYGDEAIEALGKIGDEQCANLLIERARSLVKMESRTQNALSANPILESNPEKARTYWIILRALGNLSSDSALAFLLEATQDEAPDKREEALSSAIKLWCKSGGKLTKAGEIKNDLQKSLSDPSAQVRIKAIEGVALLDLYDLIVRPHKCPGNVGHKSGPERPGKTGRKRAQRADPRRYDRGQKRPEQCRKS
jgi:HEAT repeat protein